ncbi:MAG: hypothetical protein KKI02_08850 [Planctomycetes bacterium]|nr:hypothetical protein [Planctomycetota bacterium]
MTPASTARAACCPPQRFQTGFGDDQSGDQWGDGSELDQLFVTNDNDYLYIGLSGNLQNTGNGLGNAGSVETAGGPCGGFAQSAYLTIPQMGLLIFRYHDPPDPPDCPEDLNRDGEVNLSDLAQLLGGYGITSGAAHEDGDVDGDGDVDLSDLAQLLGMYGRSCPQHSRYAAGRGLPYPLVPVVLTERGGCRRVRPYRRQAAADPRSVVSSRF